MALMDRIAVALEVFKSGVPHTVDTGSGAGVSNTAFHIRTSVDSFASAAFNRIALDCSAVEFSHVKIDPSTDKEKTMNSELSSLLAHDSNVDQTFKELIRDIVKTMFSEGTAVLVPVKVRGVTTLRVGYIRQWYPAYVEVDLYNEFSGNREPLRVHKTDCAIMPNPLYAVTNGPNATLSRLIAKMNQIDQIDAIATSGKLDLILQLPHSLANEHFMKQAQSRLDDVQSQLANNKMGMAYVGNNERITQLNRPVSDTILPQIDKLSETFHNQLGLTPNVLNGTASEEEMRAYYSRTIDVLLTTIIESMEKVFLTKTARSQGQKIVFYRNPFALVPMSQLPDLLDKISRNEISTPNEGRRIIGLKPSDDPEADVLKNRNMAPKETGVGPHPDE